MNTYHEDEPIPAKPMKPIKISEHISYKEATQSSTAVRKGIANDPNDAELENMRQLAEKVFEPLRSYISMKRGKDSPIRINSFFRSVELNKAIGGSGSSQHCANNGAAIDIETNYPDFNNKDLFMAIKEKGMYDQMIWEFGNDKEPAWVHVSYKRQDNRKQILKAVSKDGSTKYIPFA